ncbi:MAG: hypothetical protein HYW90_00375 [Candidatus Sungbacteria bacterium]|nr:hypothetical protein [Candidatus Sungbacteria bacterium]
MPYEDVPFKNSDELMQIYREVIRNKFIEVNGLFWPISALVTPTSNGRHITTDFEAFDGFMRGLRAAWIQIVSEEETLDPEPGIEKLRKATFIATPPRREPQRMVVEEYVAIDDKNPIGVSRVDIAVYSEGKRPDLENRRRIEL